MDTKEVRKTLGKAYRDQNMKYRKWKENLVGNVPDFLQSPEPLNSDIIHKLVESVDWLLKEKEKEEKTKTVMLEKLEALEKKYNLRGG